MPQHHLDLLSVQLRVHFPVLLLELSLLLCAFILQGCFLGCSCHGQKLARDLVHMNRSAPATAHR